MKKEPGSWATTACGFWNFFYRLDLARKLPPQWSSLFQFATRQGTLPQMLAQDFDTSIADLPACLLGLQPRTLPTRKYKSIPGADALVKASAPSHLLPASVGITRTPASRSSSWFHFANAPAHTPHIASWHPCGDTRTRHPPESCPSSSPPCCFSFPWGSYSHDTPV